MPTPCTALPETALLVPCTLDVQGRVAIVDVHGRWIDVAHAEADVKYLRRSPNDPYVELVAFDSRPGALRVALPAGGSVWIATQD